MGCFSKRDIVNTICAKRALKRDDVSVIVNDVFSSITDALARNDEVKLRGFGTFTMKKKAARVGRNPKTNERIDIPERLSLIFRPSKDLKNIFE